MANEEQLKILKQGVDTWNAWLKYNRGATVDLSGADFSGTKLREANLIGANLNGADFSGADLSGADLIGALITKAYLIGTVLSGANLRGVDLSDTDLIRADLGDADLIRADFIRADLSDANLSMANLGGANLRDSNLIRADLIRANLIGAELNGANLRDARTDRTQFTDVDLSKVDGLSQIIHHGPSSISLDTIRLSKGKLPIEFLRGCGLSDFEIVTAQLQNPHLSRDEFTTLTYKLDELRFSGAIHFHSCFISYSHQDRAIAEKLYGDLQESGVRCWFAPEDLKIGEKYRPRIDNAITKHDKLLLILSEHSINSSWVEQEVETALANESQDDLRLFPVRIDEAVMESKLGWPALIQRTRHIGDFTDWNNEANYEKAFDQLKQDLQQNVERNNGK